MPGISFESSVEREKPRCFRQGLFLRVFSAIQRRSTSLVPIPTARAGAGVGIGSLRAFEFFEIATSDGKRSENGMCVAAVLL